MIDPKDRDPRSVGYDLHYLIAEQQKRKATRPWKSLEQLLTDPELFGLTTATPVQRAICRVSEGVPLGELATDPGVIQVFGQTTDVPNRKPREMVILSGIRVGKSLLAGALAVNWSQTCDVSQLGPGEMPRISIVSISKDLAQIVFGHITGRIMASAKLRKLLADKPTADSVILKHPSGTPIEITVVAGSRAGSTLVARWSAGCIFDEFPRMLGEDESIVNWETQRIAVLDRVLKGGQVISIGSPWRPHGPAFDVYNAHFGKPTDQMVVCKGPAWLFNPHVWTPEKIEESKKNPDAYQTECLGEFANPEESLFSTIEVELATRKDAVNLPPDRRNTYRAAMDPATRVNSWTLVIATRIGKVKKVAYIEQWTGSKINPLSPKEVMSDIAKICKDYGITTIDSDQHQVDALKDMAAEHGIHIRQVNMSEKDKARHWLSIKTKIALKEIEIPPDKHFRSDLLLLSKRATAHGVKIVLPKTGDGRHCDYAPSFLLTMSQYLEDIVIDTTTTEDERMQNLVTRMREERMKEVKDRVLHQEKLNRIHGRLGSGKARR